MKLANKLISLLDESVSREAHIYKAKDGKWYYFIAWKEYGEFPDGDTYGPFNSEDAADKHMMKNHSNPGGFSTDNKGTKAVPTNAIKP